MILLNKFFSKYYTSNSLYLFSTKVQVPHAFYMGHASKMIQINYKRYIYRVESYFDIKNAIFSAQLSSREFEVAEGTYSGILMRFNENLDNATAIFNINPLSRKHIQVVDLFLIKLKDDKKQN